MGTPDGSLLSWCVPNIECSEHYTYLLGIDRKTAVV